MREIREEVWPCLVTRVGGGRGRGVVVGECMGEGKVGVKDRSWHAGKVKERIGTGTGRCREGEGE